MEVRNQRRVAANPECDRFTTGRAIGLGALAALAATLALAAGPGAASAQASSCENANTKPSKLSAPEARAAIACLINEKRANAGHGPLSQDGRLQRAAQKHNNRMHGTGCFSHQCPGEGSLDRRLRSVGYLRGGLARWSYAENVGWGRKKRGTPARIVDAWMSSSGHRANILSSQFRELGIGFHDGTPSSKHASGGIFTVDFGLRIG